MTDTLASRTYRVNGVTFSPDEPDPFIDQAHGVACCLTFAIEAEELNASILAEASRAVETLCWLASYGSAQLAERMRS